jgi:hypothetical protein
LIRSSGNDNLDFPQHGFGWGEGRILLRASISSIRGRALGAWSSRNRIRLLVIVFDPWFKIVPPSGLSFLRHVFVRMARMMFAA